MALKRNFDHSIGRRNRSIHFLFCIITILFFSSISFSATLKIGWTVEPDSSSPFIAYNLPAAEMFLLLYDPLISLNENLEPEGKIAKSWTLSEDSLQWTFTLQQGLTWHDGTPLTSADVKFSYEAFLSSGLGLYAGFLNGIVSIDCPNDLTVIINTEEPKANMLMGNTPILPRHIWESIAVEDLEIWENDPVIGSGAFTFYEWRKGEYLHLKRNEGYTFQKPQIEDLIFILFANNDTLAQAIKTGEIDAGVNINPIQIPELQKLSFVQAISVPSNGFTHLAFNCWENEESNGNPLLKDFRIRKAIDWALDKQAILDISYLGQGVAGTTLVPPVLKQWHYVPSKEEIRTYSPEKASALLEESGYKMGKKGLRTDSEGHELSFRLYLRSSNTQEIKAGQMIKKYLLAIGIEVLIETMDDGLLTDLIYTNADFDMFIWGWGADIDPTTILNVMSSNEIGGLSDSYFSNEEYDRLLSVQATLLDSTARQQAVYAMQRILYEQVPYSVLFYDNEFQAVRTDRFSGWKKVPEDGFFFFTVNSYNYIHATPIR